MQWFYIVLLLEENHTAGNLIVKLHAWKTFWCFSYSSYGILRLSNEKYESLMAVEKQEEKKSNFQF